VSSWIAANLHPDLHIDFASLSALKARGEKGPASVEDLAVLKAGFLEVPEDYLDIVSEYGWIAAGTQPPHKPYFYIGLASPADVLDWRILYSYSAEDLPNCFFFGMDGDRCFFVGENAGRKGVYQVAIAGPDWQWAEYLAPSIKALLCDGVGWADKS
jgi:hypothetical protein